MPISYDNANYTPPMRGYSGQGAFRFWCQTVLPIVYDDSLSYYELLNKVVVYLNNTISDVANVEDNVQDLHDAYVNLQGYVNDTYNELTSFVNNYFDNLDVQTEINNKLDAMAENGDLTQLISPFIPNAVGAWLEENITPTTPVVDKTLSISGAAADAQVVGYEFGAFEIDISSDVSWRTKQINPTNGNIYTNDSSTNISTTDYLPNLVKKIVCADNYKFEVFVYEADGTYKGSYSDGEFYTTNKWLTGVLLLTEIGNNYLYKVQLAKTSGADISLSDASNITLISFLDDTLTLNGKAPNSKTVGEKIKDTKSIADYLGENLAVNYTPLDAQWYINATTDRLQKTASLGVATISIPIEAGQKYTVKKRTSTVMRIGVGGDIPEGATTYDLTKAVRHSTASSDALTIRAGENDTKLYIQLYSNQDSDEYKNIDANISSLVVTIGEGGGITNFPYKMRVMTYNVGGYNYGTHTLPPSADIPAIISAYRSFYAKYHPDIVSLNEFAFYLDEDEQYSADNEIYNVPFPYKYPTTALGVQDYTRSKHLIENNTSQTISYTEDNVEKHITCRISHFNIGNKAIAYITTHLFNDKTDYGVRARTYWLQQIVSLLANYSYAIFAGDMNFGGNMSDAGRTEDITSDDEVASKIALMKSLGYGVANGGYLAPVGTVPNSGNCIDHIFYKDNGNIVFNDCKVLADEYSNLYSDHYPVIADFIIE